MKTNRRDLPLGAYLRVSTAAQAESGIGLNVQRKAIEDAAAGQGLTLGRWFEDAGRSAARADNRPGLQAALRHILHSSAWNVLPCHASAARRGGCSRDRAILVT